MQTDVLSGMAEEKVDYGLDRIEQLRQILVAEHGSILSYEEALEIGESLVDFYKVLSEGN